MDDKYNDNELLYLISENNEIAFEKLCEKYRPLIINRLKRFRIKKNFEDFYQECLIVLYKCALLYREDKSTTFNKYLDKYIQFRIQVLLRKECQYFYNVELKEYEEIDKHHVVSDLREDLDGIVQINCIRNELSTYEKRVLEYMKDGYNINEISVFENKDLRSVYNAIGRVKGKITKKAEIKKERAIVCRGLSPLEETVYEKYIEGFKAREISEIMNCKKEVVYDALKRIRLKASNEQK